MKRIGGDEARTKALMSYAHEQFKDAGMPEDRIDYILKKWAKNAVEDDDQGCIDKGKYGVWCPKGDEWYCKKNCEKEKKPKREVDEDGCIDKGRLGYWCPNGNGGWYCEKNCGIRPDANGCYDKGDKGVWCPKGDDWYCKEGCKGEKKEEKKVAGVLLGEKNGCYDK